MGTGRPRRVVRLNVSVPANFAGLLPGVRSMPAEVWLRPNRRPAMVVTYTAVTVAAVSLIILAVALLSGLEERVARGTAFLTTWLAGVAGLVGLVAYFGTRQPRIYREGPRLYFRIARPPIAIPIKVVEAFFLGQGPAHLPARMGKQLETMNLVARLSERATEWHQRETDRRLGEWCGGYITVRGTWCEPLTVDMVHRLNRMLSQAKREAAEDD